MTEKRSRIGLLVLGLALLGIAAAGLLLWNRGTDRPRPAGSLRLVRSTNSGVSAVVDPTGRVVARTGLLTRESLRAVVYPREADTLYTRFGDWPGAFAVALVALGLAVGAPRQTASPRRRSSA